MICRQSEIELMEKLAASLEEWADRNTNDRSLLAEGYLLSAKFALKDFPTVLHRVRFRHPELSKSLEEAEGILLQWTRAVDRDYNPKGVLTELQIAAAKDAARNLANMLREISGIAREESSAVKQSYIEPKEIVEVKPGAFGITVNIKEIAKRILKRFFSRSKD